MPCLSTEWCVAPPWVGDFIEVNTVPVGEPWQRNTTKLNCEKEEHYFFLQSLDYPAELEVSCVPSLLFNAHSPYWEIPGMDYPATTELYCVNARICRDFSDLRKEMDALGFMDNFDEVNTNVGDTFQYFCSMEGQRGCRTVS